MKKNILIALLLVTTSTIHSSAEYTKTDYPFIKNISYNTATSQEEILQQNINRCDYLLENHAVNLNNSDIIALTTEISPAIGMPMDRQRQILIQRSQYTQKLVHVIQENMSKTEKEFDGLKENVKYFEHNKNHKNFEIVQPKIGELMRDSSNFLLEL